jgi:hypothetical protein
MGFIIADSVAADAVRAGLTKIREYLLNNLPPIGRIQRQISSWSPASSASVLTMMSKQPTDILRQLDYTWGAGSAFRTLL